MEDPFDIAKGLQAVGAEFVALSFKKPSMRGPLLLDEVVCVGAGSMHAAEMWFADNGFSLPNLRLATEAEITKWRRGMSRPDESRFR